jgi:hypothetical protein
MSEIKDYGVTVEEYYVNCCKFYVIVDILLIYFRIYPESESLLLYEKIV